MDILSAGLIVVDVLARPVDSLPPRGQLRIMDSVQVHLGGPAAATAVVLGKLGGKVGFAGRVGTDGLGDFLANKLQSHAVDTRGLVRDPQNATTTTLVLISSDGERSFLYFPGASGEFTDADIDLDLMGQARFYHFGGVFNTLGMDGEPLARSMAKAKSLGKTTSIDTAWDATERWMETLGPSLPHIDWCFCGIKEGTRLTGKNDPAEIAAALHGFGTPNVVVKLGEQGSLISTPGGHLRASAYEVTVVDTTGAGDSYVAAFLFGLANGWDLEKTGRFASAVGSLAVTKIGGTEGIQSLEHVLEFMKTTKQKA